MLQFERFSQFVAQSVRRGDYAIAESFIGGPYIVNKDRMDRTNLSHASRCQTDDEWSLHLNSWWFGLWPRATIIRGTKNYIVPLTREEKIGLAHIYKGILQEAKDKDKAERLAYKQAESYSNVIIAGRIAADA